MEQSADDCASDELKWRCFPVIAAGGPSCGCDEVRWNYQLSGDTSNGYNCDTKISFLIR